MSFGEYIKKMRKKKAWTLDRLANLVSREAENFFTNHGEQAYKGLTLSKYQLSHIENDSRQPDKEVLNLLIKVLEIKAFDLQELQKICQEFGIGNELPDSLKVLTPATQEIIRQQEITRQKGFTDIHIISDSPLEIMPISEENLFLLDFIKELQSPENNQNKYTYWTLESSINKFKILFSFMNKSCYLPSRNVHILLFNLFIFYH
jgi:transcriptional regulator with XRE-family HTH domain